MCQATGQVRLVVVVVLAAAAVVAERTGQSCQKCCFQPVAAGFADLSTLDCQITRHFAAYSAAGFVVDRRHCKRMVVS